MTAKDVVIPKLPELEFDDPTHTYRLHGFIIPSVSAVMKPLSDANYKGISEATLDKAAAKGTSVHNSIENYIDYGITDVNPEHAGFFQGFLKWVEDVKPEFVVSEYRVYHKTMMYGGTCDILAIIDGKLTLIDVKTVYSINKKSKKMYGVQLEAYNRAMKDLGIKVEEKQILHLKNNGEYELIHYPMKEPIWWIVFSALKVIYDFINDD